MELRQLEYFVEVVKEESFTRASRRLMVSQPAISKTIRSMEEELGVILLNRTSRKIDLTDAGCAIYEKARNVLISMEQLTDNLDQVSQLKKGSIHIGIPPVVGAGFFPEVISRFKDRYPGIEIQLMEVGTKSIEHGVIDGTLDVGVICSLPAADDKFDRFLLMSDPILLVMHRDHPLGKEKRNVSFRELTKESFVIYRRDFSLHDRILSQCEQAGFSPKIVCESSQRDFMTEMVATGLGIAFLPKRVCGNLDPLRFKTLPIEGEPLSLDLSLIWKRDKYVSHAAREWLRFVKDSF
ncbi:LysR family transcriptional regulator [Anoxynatronum sibiricum]|uniref:LysR family transcriptional regulator n=1 Tax=Anoxynatronum sibiricum TaxID=210623 RepID=A0ABU9VXW4_9CLOT